MTPTQHLSLREGLPKLRDAIDNELLGAFKYDTCQYSYPSLFPSPSGEHRCAIGWMLDDDLIEYLKVTPIWNAEDEDEEGNPFPTLNCEPLLELVNREIITLEAGDEARLRLLQQLHDYWASLKDRHLSSDIRRALERVGFATTDDTVYGKKLFLDFVAFLETKTAE